ncbi:MAG: lipid A biosynthesis lauroyl acyltransferase [Hoeflea sp.]|nr:lipid A biosynthesis lauroyl acyltransferase [Hoeflea sp.]
MSEKLPHPFIVKTFVITRKVRHWLVGTTVISLLKLASLFPADPAINAVEWLARRIGPKTSRHRLALYNLALAFPEKSAEEHERIARDMWGNMARLGVEYVFLDKIFDLNLDNPSEGRVEVDGVEIFAKLTEEKKPFIVFTAHTGNFELLPIGAAAYGLEVTALFRPPNNPYIARHVLSARRTHMGHLVPSRAGAAIALARKLDDGGGVGMLVDQKFQRGAKSTFFGHTVQTNPLLGKLARQFNCDVYPARCIRLPGGRFRLQIEPAIEVPRAEDGRVDVPATCQLLNDKVEAWVREYPGQWQWFHDRWAIKHKVK